ncbi:unnamed protein product [Aphanomyces euteiches]
MGRVKQIVELARIIRNDTGLKNRQPLSELIVIMEGELGSAAFAEIIQDEMNVKAIRVQSQNNELTDYSLKMNLKLAGPKYGKLISGLQAYLKSLAQAEIVLILENGFFDYKSENGDPIRISLEEVLVERQAKPGFASATGYNMTVSLNTSLTPDLEKEGMVRELIRAIQDLRKKFDLPIDKRIDLVINADEEMRSTIVQFDDLIQKNVLLKSVKFAESGSGEQIQIADKTLWLGIE